MIVINNLFSWRAGFSRWLGWLGNSKPSWHGSMGQKGSVDSDEKLSLVEHAPRPVRDLSVGADSVYTLGAQELVEQQLTRSLNVLADTIHAKSQDIRNKSDIFLEFGIADQQIMHAGSLAQLAISYAHYRRGPDVGDSKSSGGSSSSRGPSGSVTFEDRKIKVQTALALLKEAEQRYQASYQSNKKLLDRAFLAREQSLARYKELVANA